MNQFRMIVAPWPNSRAVRQAVHDGGIALSSGCQSVRAMLVLLCWMTSAAAVMGAERVWEVHSGYRLAPLAAPGTGKPGFTLLPGPMTGVLFTNQLQREAEAVNQNLLNGAGLALGDYDNDGWCDIFLCNLNGSCALYRNLGNWTFTNVTVQAGLANTNWLARGAVFADVDGDGHLDLLLTRSGKGTRLFLNNGRGGFVESAQPELAAETGSTSLTLADIDGDGDLDLYVANYGENTIRSGMKVATRIVGGKEQVVGRMRNRLKILNGQLIEYGEPDVLYRNDGHGRFTRVSWTDGTFRDESGAPLASAPWDLGLTATFRDINQDGYPDLYVCNDFQDPDRIWINNGHGQFQAIRREAMRLSSQFSMSVDFADFNHDGFEDFIVSDMLSPQHALRMTQLDASPPPPERTFEKAWDRPQIHRNTLFLNRGDATYTELANFAGVAATDWTWTVNCMDVDLDGWDDILVGTGHPFDTLDIDATERSKRFSPAQRNDPRTMLDLFPPLPTPNLAFRNRGNLTFQEVGKAWGFDATDVSQSMAFADLDNDGDLDIVVNCLNSAALVYRNNCSAPRLAVRLRGLAANTAGIGAKIKVLNGAVPVQMKEVTSGGRYLGGDAPERVFAAGTATNLLTVEVTWRSGKRCVIPGLKPNQIVEVDESSAQPFAPDPAPKPAPLFQEGNSLPQDDPLEEPFDDFARQPLLPRPLSQLGPGIAWIDLDNDGAADLVVGAGRGGKLAFYHNDGHGKLSAWPGQPAAPLPDDATGLVEWSPGRGQTTLLAGLANYESAQPQAVLRFDRAASSIVPGPSLPGSIASSGPLAVADIDGDGDLDLFVGGRVVPGRYPEAAASRIFRNDSGKLVADGVESRAFEKVGLVSGAIFTDLDGDGRPELVLACEWGPIRIFHRAADGRGWQEVTRAWATLPLSGLWTSVAAGDFDGDGRMDLVVGNLGLNSAYQQVAPGPWHLYFGDFNSDGQLHILEAFTDAASNKVVPWRQLGFLEHALPWLRGSFPTHHAYSQASIEQILAIRPVPVQHLTASHLESVLLLNRGDHFESRPLPAEAQWAPVFGIAVADFDGDGREDLFLSQNNYAVRPEDARLDGGRGLLLRGDGTGGFSAVSGADSGIAIYGEQRGCAVADVDRDGRPDLAVAVHQGPPHLFHNQTGRPGLQVRLVGPPENPHAIGAVARLYFAGQAGPAREVHGGSGYWSQDSTSLVLATPSAPEFLEVRWPAGKVTRTPVPKHATSLQVDQEGKAQ